MAKHPDVFELAVSHTTRHMRDKEENGKNYHFISKDAFMNEIAKNTFLEWFEREGNYFGI